MTSGPALQGPLVAKPETKGETMVYYDTPSRLRFAREHAERLEADMRNSNRPRPDEAGSPDANPGRARGWSLMARFERLRRSHHTPAYHS
jgi:hypothetical protein